MEAERGGKSSPASKRDAAKGHGLNWDTAKNCSFPNFPAHPAQRAMQALYQTKRRWNTAQIQGSFWSPRHAEGQHYLQGEFPQHIQRQSARCLSGVAHLQAGLSSNPPDTLRAATASHFRHTGIKTLGLFSACFAS